VIIVDASVLTNAFTDDGVLGERARAELGRDHHWAAPEHLVTETFAAIQGRLAGGAIGPERAHEAVRALLHIPLDLLAVQPLLAAMWAARDHAVGYDAAYVAAAEVYQCVMVTADARLAQAASARKCHVRLA
jgi:predicted nucleic acid-binding protein